MRIKKTFQGTLPENKIVNTQSNSQTDTYSCDYINGIIESGSNDNGNWTKWADGTMICTQNIELNNVSINTAWGSLYVYAEPAHNWRYFPQPFTEIQSFSMEVLNQTAYNGFWIGDYGRRRVELDRWDGVCLVRPTTVNVTATLCVTAIGKWK